MKTVLLEQVLAQLQRECETLTRAALEARGEATHAESKQENKYDTRGLEASYLADGQSRRAAEIRQNMDKLREIPLGPASDDAPIRAGALVEVNRGGGAGLTRYFLLPYVGGLDVSHQGRAVKVISTQSPLGRELLGKRAGDEFRFNGQPYEIVDVQ